MRLPETEVHNVEIGSRHLVECLFEEIRIDLTADCHRIQRELCLRSDLVHQQRHCGAVIRGFRRQWAVRELLPGQRGHLHVEGSVDDSYSAALAPSA